LGFSFGVVRTLATLYSVYLLGPSIERLHQAKRKNNCESKGDWHAISASSFFIRY
jgi:hypothetical protein